MSCSFSFNAPVPPRLPDIAHGTSYELVSAEDGETFLRTVLTAIPVEVPANGERDVYDDDLMLDTAGETLTPEQFAGKYLSPVSGPDLGESYGKEN